MRRPQQPGTKSLQTGGRPCKGSRGWGCPGPTPTVLGELLPPHLPLLHLLSVEVGLGLDGADGGRGLGRSPSPQTQEASSQNESQE